MYRFIRKLSTGFEVHRSRRNTSGLEGHHLHLRCSHHPGAKNSGPAVWMLLFDLSWNVRAHAAAGFMPDIGHSWVWLVDALLDIVQVNKLSSKCVPAL
jgi:hypothetical protein